MHLAAQEGLPLQFMWRAKRGYVSRFGQAGAAQGMDLRKLIRHYSLPDVRDPHHGLTRRAVR